MVTAPSLTASIIIPSLGRGECLRNCIASLKKQEGNYAYETIVVTEEGPLAAIRNQGFRRASGDIVIFVDDDTTMPPQWLRGVMAPFADISIVGVSGPAVIPIENQRQRDIFKWPKIKSIYDRVFLDGKAHLPGHITTAGTWTTGAVSENCDYEGPVDFLEACNMAFRRRHFEAIGGFDETFQGIGDWSEPDACFRIRRAGGTLWFSRWAKLYHHPSRTGAYTKRRADSRNRLANYHLFASRWVEPHWKHTAYKAFLKTYYTLKENHWI